MLSASTRSLIAATCTVNPGAVVAAAGFVAGVATDATGAAASLRAFVIGGTRAGAAATGGIFATGAGFATTAGLPTTSGFATAAGLVAAGDWTTGAAFG